ncbi:MAG: hypothetical protein IJR99_16240 [Kiritimatiellae bacterium]|nr:hypothetical protein [Kiritimatiellia bacterium]
MPVTFADFKAVADSAFFSSRDVVLSGPKGAEDAKLGRFGRVTVTKSDRTLNDATMEAFRKALSDKYGFFGEHAFDTVIGTRAQLHQSLRVRDIQSVISQLEPLKRYRFVNELRRQLDTDPALMQLGPAVKSAVSAAVSSSLRGQKEKLKACENPADIAKLVSDMIHKAAANVVEGKMPDEDGRISSLHADLGMGRVEKEVSATEPTGLKRLQESPGSMFRRWQTSVEDRVKSGALGVGMRINSGGNPIIFEKLKTNGVEPGFIFRNDWSRDDTRGLMADVFSAKSRQDLQRIVDAAPAGSPLRLAAERNASIRELGFLVGRSHPLGIAFAAEYLLERAFDHPESKLGKQLHERFPNLSKADIFPADPNQEPSAEQKRTLVDVKTLLFAQIRDAVMYPDPDDPDPARKNCSIFRHFSDRKIAKLDYNENDRALAGAPGSSGYLKLPERVSVKGGAFKGFFYRTFRLTTADEASSGAVAEALANDLTRLTGVPAQELSIMRGKYADEHPKLMLEAKFATGYSDFDGVYIQDGRIVPPAGHHVESLGKYKAMFLLLADRDAVGSHGQNKGFRILNQDALPGEMLQAQFFAIDPGHSLEGNGKDLEIHDNLSFRDTSKKPGEKRFLNFSVFDDDTRFAKFQGVLQLYELAQSGRAGQLFDSYRQQFDPNADGGREKGLRTKIIARINEMEQEFNAQMTKILSVFGPQISFYEALANDGAAVQEGAIEMIENLEKLTSPTTWESAGKEVKLQHLEVIEKTRIPWSAHVEGDNLVYSSRKPVPAEMQDTILSWLGNLPDAKFQIDEKGNTIISVPKNQAARFFATFSEDRVAKHTHPEEYAARHPAPAGAPAQPPPVQPPPDQPPPPPAVDSSVPPPPPADSVQPPPPPQTE